MKSAPSLNLMEILIELLADQENVKITYELEVKEDVRCMPKVAM